MAKNLKQNAVIRHLNKYLKWHNLPVRMNKTGICNGLAMVHIKYVLENKEQQFFDMLHYISSGELKNNLKEEDINRFVIEVSTTFNPRLFSSKLNQARAIEILKVDRQYLNSSFDLGMVTRDKNWEEIIADLQLQEREVLQVSSINHSATVHRVNGKYQVYDPNYESGYKDFDDEKKLIKELHQVVFFYDEGYMGLDLHLIRHPADLHKERHFPSVRALYEKHLIRVNARATTIDKGYNSLVLAATYHDEEIVRYLLDKGADDIYVAANYAVINNNIQALPPLLDKLTHDDQKMFLFKQALEKKRKEAFLVLLNHPQLNAYYTENLANIKSIEWAAKGGNPELLLLCLDKFKVELKKTAEQKFRAISKREPSEAIKKALDENILKIIGSEINALKMTERDIISHAILSGNRECVHILCQYLNSGGYPLVQAERIHYLTEAIRTNQRYIALELIKMEPKLSPRDLQAIHLTTRAVSRTDLALLKDLEKHGMHFSKVAKNIIAKKEHQSLGIISTLGVMLYKFTDYFKEQLNKKPMGIFYDKEIHQQIKNKLQDLKSPESSQENLNTGVKLP